MTIQPNDLLLDENEAEQVQKMAERRGFQTIRAYLRHLVDLDALEHDEAQLIEDQQDPTIEEINQMIREAEEDEKHGRLLTWEELVAANEITKHQ
jgi:hypothetical protein